MSAPISVIIPTFEAASRIGPCLAALAHGAFDGMIAELIIADGGSSDDIATLADGVGARLVQAPRGRGTQLAAGADAARADWLFFLHADTVLGESWPTAVRAHIEGGPGKAAHARLAFESAEPMARMTAGWANLRARMFGLPYGDQGLLIHRTLYRSVGGYPAIPLMEDVAIVRRIGRRRLRQLDTTATTDAERYRRDGWIRRGARNLGTLALYLMGRDPARLVTRYERR